MLTLRTIALDHDGRVANDEMGLVSAWFRARGGEPPNRAMLPTCGAVVEAGETPAAIGFLYMDATGSGVAWLSWLVSNPKLSPITTGKAIVHLVKLLCELAKEFGYWCIVSNFNTPSLNRYLARHGFTSGDTGATLQFKPL